MSAIGLHTILLFTLADLGGRALGRFFRFDIQNFRNVTASGVHAPLRGSRPLREILDPPLIYTLLCRVIWTAVLLAMFSWMCFQLTTRIKEFINKPVSVNMRFINNKRIKFPAVTICNSKRFQVSFLFLKSFFITSRIFVKQNFILPQIGKPLMR